jgi:hypothetical protein
MGMALLSGADGGPRRSGGAGYGSPIGLVRARSALGSVDEVSNADYVWSPRVNIVVVVDLAHSLGENRAGGSATRQLDPAAWNQPVP